MALLDDVKVALRITHTRLDSEITALIASAREDMVRAGVDSSLTAADTSNLVTSAIKTYVLARMSDTQALMDGYQKSYEYQLDALRKSSGYRAEEDEESTSDETEGE